MLKLKHLTSILYNLGRIYWVLLSDALGNMQVSKIFLPCSEVAEAQVCGSDVLTWNWIHAHSSQSMVYTVLKSGVCGGRPGRTLSHCPSWATCVSCFLQKDWIPTGWGFSPGMGGEETGSAVPVRR